MSNVTFLIGNGFDLACGLKTRFIDMYPAYTQTVSANSAIKQFKTDITNDGSLHFERWSDFEMGLAGYAQNWHSEEEMLTCIEDFTTFMIQHISKEQRDFSAMLTARVKDFTSQEILDSTRTFYRGLPHNDPVHRIDDLLSDETVNLFFLSFNYTSILDGLLTAAFSGVDKAHMRVRYHNPIHIHGILSGPVLGVDNEQQIHNLQFALSTSGKRALIKPQYNREYDTIQLERTLDTIQKSDVICVYGKRFGPSDQMWNQAIGEWLIDNSAHELIYYDHNSSLFQSNISWRRMDKEESTKQRLTEELFNSNEIGEQVFSQIHVPIGSDIFRIARAVEAGRAAEEKTRPRIVSSTHQ